MLGSFLTGKPRPVGGCFTIRRAKPTGSPQSMRPALHLGCRYIRSGVEAHGLTVMSTSFLSSTLLDAGSVVLFMEPHPARNATQIRHAINFFIFIKEHLLPSACRRSLLINPLPPSGQRANPTFDVRAALRREILVPECLLVDDSCLLHPALPLVYLAQQHVGIRVVGVA